MQIASAEKRDDTSEAARLRQEYEEQQEAWRAQQDLNLVAPRDVNIDAPPLSSSKVQNLRILLERSAAASQALLSAEDHFMRGNGFRAAEEYDRAVLPYTRSIELDSSLSNAYGNRGDTYTKIGDYHHAFGSRVPGSGVRGRGSGERETTASSLAGKQQAREKEDNGGQGKDGPAGAIAQGGNGR